VDEIKIGNMKLIDVIYSKYYFITLFDIWLMVEEFKIPIIILSQKLLFNNKHVVSLYSDDSGKYIYLITSPSRNDHVINFQIFYLDENIFKLPLDIITCPSKLKEITNSIENIKTINEYLDTYVIVSKTKYIKKISGQKNSEKIVLKDVEEEDILKLKPKKQRKKLDLTNKVIINEEGNKVDVEVETIPKKARKPYTRKKLDLTNKIIIDEQ
jgi:hypothetical protein